MITSTDNKQVKNLNALIKKARERRSQQVFVVEGPRMCFEAPFDWLKSIYVSEYFLEDASSREKLEKYIADAKAQGYTITYEVLKDSVFKSVSDTMTPQGIIAIVAMPAYSEADLLKGDETLLLVLDNVQDPGNLGTMIRTAEGAGATGIIMNKTTVDIFNPKTIRSTMGSMYRMPFIIVENLPECIESLKGKGVSFYAAHLKGKESYDAMDYKKATAFMIGNEGNGLSDEVADAANIYIRIPMAGKLESLNAAVSGALLMYECNRQRRQ